MVNDTLADSLIRIKNAVMRGKSEVELPHTRIVEEVCRILKANNRITDFKTMDKTEESFKKIIVTLDKNDENLINISDVKRVSKPGLRIYRGYRDLKTIREGYGFAILTTPKGVITDREARKQKVGGELICEIF